MSNAIYTLGRAEECVRENDLAENVKFRRVAETFVASQLIARLA